MRGAWVFATRAGAEADLVAELSVHPGAAARGAPGSGLVTSALAPLDPEGGLALTFARQGFVASAELPLDAPASDLAAAVLRVPLAERPWCLHAWVPDTDAGNRRADAARTLETRLLEALASAGGPSPGLPSALPAQGGLVVHLLVREGGSIVVGATPSELSLSRFPGGRARMRVAGSRPSRASMKLEEAFSWLGVSPGTGDRCADLGAAPGGWTFALLARRARVVAVDPARLLPELTRHPRVEHVHGSAFTYAPEEPFDWVLCDMAWRPLEVAELLAKWARRRWARALVANFKLPMKQKTAIVSRIRGTLADAGWRSIRTRQLYHDRDEITATAWLRA